MSLFPFIRACCARMFARASTPAATPILRTLTALMYYCVRRHGRVTFTTFAASRAYPHARERCEESCR